MNIREFVLVIDLDFELVEAGEDKECISPRIPSSSVGLSVSLPDLAKVKDGCCKSCLGRAEPIEDSYNGALILL